MFLLENGYFSIDKIFEKGTILTLPIDEKTFIITLMSLLPYSYMFDDNIINDSFYFNKQENISMDHLSIEELNEMKKIMENELMKDWIVITEFMILDKWAEFGNKIKNYGEKYKAKPLESFGKQVIDNVNCLNIVELKKIIKQFPEFSEMFVINYLNGGS